MIIKPLMLLHYTLTLSPICEWDLERIWNGLGTEVDWGNWNPQRNLLYEHMLMRNELLKGLAESVAFEILYAFVHYVNSVNEEHGIIIEQWDRGVVIQ